MCPSRTDQPKAETTRIEETEIEVKPSELCLTYSLQVTLLLSSNIENYTDLLLLFN